MDDDSFLEICRQSGRLNDLVNRLLQLDRLGEAICETEKADDYNLLTLADVFVERGHGTLAERMVHARAKTSRDFRLSVWLKDYASLAGDFPIALEWAKQLFLLRPSTTEYLEIKKLAIQINLWPDIRSETIDWLTNHQPFGVLVEIYLEESEIDLALDALEKARTTARYRWEYPYSLDITVAEAAEASRPEQAIQLYLARIKSLINRRGRDNYGEACNYLKVIQGIYKRLGRKGDWQSLLTKLQQENWMLPAFKDELKKAGL